MNKQIIEETAFWIVAAGAIDMGLYALIGGDTDIINMVFSGSLSILALVFEALVGISAVYLVYLRLIRKKSEAKK